MLRVFSVPAQTMISLEASSVEKQTTHLSVCEYDCSSITDYVYAQVL
jgi:hypothetical protein